MNNNLLYLVMLLLLIVLVLVYVVMVNDSKQSKKQTKVNIIGGCSGTRYGCCPDGRTPKLDNFGSNGFIVKRKPTCKRLETTPQKRIINETGRAVIKRVILARIKRF